MWRAIPRRRAQDSGSVVVEGLLGLALVLLAVGIGVEGVLVVDARTIALAAADAGAREAAIAGADAGLASARQVLSAGGRLGGRLAVSVTVNADTVTVRISGAPPAPFAVGVLLPRIDVAATCPLERYPVDLAAAA